ncbi:hypothetical protein EV182_001553, partial [Spiromyces aspiralis]
MATQYNISNDSISGSSDRPTLAGFCPDREGWGPWSPDRLVDLTPCFQWGVIDLGLQLTLLVFASFRIRSLKKIDPLPAELTRSVMYSLKRYLIAGALALSLWRLAYEVYYVHQYPTVFSLNLLVRIVALSVTLHLQHLEQHHNRFSSSILLLYWLVSLIVGLSILYTSTVTGARHAQPVEWHLQVALLILQVLVFGLELAPRRMPNYYLLTNSNNASVDLDILDVAPEDKANIFSKLTFSWMSPLLHLGYQRPLAASDLWSLPRMYQPYRVADDFNSDWHRRLQQAAESSPPKSPSLFWSLSKTFGPQFMFAGLLKVCQDVLQFIQPVLLSRLIEFASSQSTDSPQPITNGYFYAITMFVTAVVQTLFLHQYFQLAIGTGLRLRSGLVAAIYSKALVMSSSARQEYSVGDIVNRISVDTSRISEMTNYGHISWSGPLQIVIALTLLYQTLGWSIFAGVFMMVASIPLNSWMTRKMSQLHRAQMSNKDARMKLIDESLAGMKVIKLYAWTKAFLDRIRQVRNERELATLRRFGVLSAGQNVIMNIMPTMVSIVTFAIYALLDGKSRGPLNAQLIFVSVSLFNLLRFPLAMFPMVITALVEANVALGRIHKFLICEELDSSAVVRQDYVRRSKRPDQSEDNGEKGRGSNILVQIKDGAFSWTSNPSHIYQPAIEHVNLECRSDELMAVVGRVGSGKSSLISALLGEMNRLEGEVTVRGRVAYVSQQPWIMNSSLRENILFGHHYDPVFYEQTIKACALTQDIDMLPGGDMTEIGEKGINLSGGQRARVALARAVYARADVYLLDDPLSAVDAHVGRHIFNNVLGSNGLLKSRARILVTHAIHFLDQCDTVVMMRDGHIVESGAFTDIMTNRSDSDLVALFREFGESSSQTPTPVQGTTTTCTPVRGSPRSSTPIGAALTPSGFLNSEAVDPETVEEDELPDASEEGPKLDKVRRPSMASSITSAKAAPYYRSLAEAERRDTRDPNKPAVAANEALMTEETVRTGSIGWPVYKAYFKSCGFSGMIIFMLTIIGAQAFTVGGNIWLKVWASDNEKYARSNEPNPNGPTFYLGVYLLLGVLSAMFTWWRSIVLWAKCAIHSAEKTHEQMLVSVFRAPMWFFDTTPLGRILNRFGKDQDTIDEILPRSFATWVQTLLQVVFSIGVIIGAMPAYILVVIPLSIVYMMLQRYYLCSSRELKRLDSVSRSPIYAHFQETLGGLSTIRAYGQASRFLAENERRLEYNQRAYYPYLSLNRWLAVRLEFIGALLIFSAALLSVIVLDKFGYIDASIVGLAVSYSLNITQSLNWCIRMYCEIETNIVSMERIMEYANLPSEAPEVIPDSRPPPAWPTRGQIAFDHYSTRYRTGL